LRGEPIQRGANIPRLFDRKADSPTTTPAVRPHIQQKGRPPCVVEELGMGKQAGCIESIHAVKHDD
jgi:hypothetical protein